MKKLALMLVILAVGGTAWWGLHRSDETTQPKAREMAEGANAPRPEIPRPAGFPDRICDIRDYGATPGIEAKSTVAINQSISECASAGGGTVLIPEGAWLTGAVQFKSRIHLYLAQGSELHFSTDLKDYLPIVFTRFQGIEFYNFSPLIYGNGVQEVAITGPGKLIGYGDEREDWTGGGNFETARKQLFDYSLQGTPVAERVFGERQPGLRPSFVQFINARNILLDGFTVENGPIWTIHPVYAENFTARNLTIKTWGGNTDGIVLDSVKNALVEDSFFSTGDDAISIKSGIDEDGRRVNRPTEQVKIRNITVIKGSAGVSIGSEMSGGVRDIDIRDSHFENTRHGFRIKSTRSRGGFIENVLVENVTMDRTSGDALDLNLAYSSELQTRNTNKPRIKNIVMRGISGTGIENGVINIDGMPNPLMEDVRFENIRFTASETAVRINHADHVTLKDIQIEAEKSPLYVIEDGQHILVDTAPCQSGTSPCFRVGGGKTADITLQNIDQRGVAPLVEVTEHAPPSSVTVR